MADVDVSGPADDTVPGFSRPGGAAAPGGPAAAARFDAPVDTDGDIETDTLDLLPDGAVPGTGVFRVGPDAEAMRRAFRATFHGRPAQCVSVLRDSAVMAGPVARWLLGVSLGTMGRYEQARVVLAGGVGEPDSLLVSARASHLRQLGRHVEAEALDGFAADRAPRSALPDAARYDAALGLVADAVGRGDSGEALRRLRAAALQVQRLSETAHWRAYVRLAWVYAEVAMLDNDAGTACAAGAEALRRSRLAAAPRHETKSLLVLGVAAYMRGREDAAELLGSAAERATRMGVTSLVWPARMVLARVLERADPAAAERERRAAQAVVASLAAALPPEDAAAFLARNGRDVPVNG